MKKTTAIKKYTHLIQNNEFSVNDIIEVVEEFESDTRDGTFLENGMILRVVLADDEDIRVNTLANNFAVDQWIFEEHFDCIRLIGVHFFESFMMNTTLSLSLIILDILMNTS